MCECNHKPREYTQYKDYIVNKKLNLRESAVSIAVWLAGLTLFITCFTVAVNFSETLVEPVLSFLYMIFVMFFALKLINNLMSVHLVYTDSIEWIRPKQTSLNVYRDTSQGLPELESLHPKPKKRTTKKSKKQTKK